MFLYLARHGHASKPSPDQPSFLTGRGKAEIARTLSRLKPKKISFTLVWHSSKPRALQTAFLYLEALGAPGALMEEKEELGPGGEPESVLELIRGVKTESLLIVSHLPLLEALTRLISRESGEKPSIPFPTAGIACFRRNKDGYFEFSWHLGPND